MHRPLAALALALVFVAGCAAQRPGPPPGAAGGGGGRDGPPQRAANLFISPAGEPFRGGPEGASPLITWFNAADLDHDGRLSPAEFTADHQRFFKTLDVDGDGAIGSDEISRYETQIAPEILPSAFQTGGGQARGGQAPRGGGGGGGGGGRGGGGGGPGGGFPGGGGGGGGGRGGPGGAGGAGGGAAGANAVLLTGAAQFSLLADPEPVRAADANIDFRVSLAEWTAIAQTRFARLDENHDGVLTLSELHWPRQGGGGGGGGRRG